MARQILGDRASSPDLAGTAAQGPSSPRLGPIFLVTRRCKTGDYLKPNLMGSADCGPTIKIVPAPSGTSSPDYGLSVQLGPFFWGCLGELATARQRYRIVGALAPAPDSIRQTARQPRLTS